MVAYIFIAVGIIIIGIFIVNKTFDTKRFINDLSPFFKKLIESDYRFLLQIRYGESSYDINKLFQMRIRNGLIGIILGIFAMIILNKLQYWYAFILIGLGLGFYLYKQQYFNLKAYYKRRLHQIDLLLPYYLKGLEILIEHFTVPVALAKSIETAPYVFKEGLRKLVDKIDHGDSSIQPYIDFANEYPVRDSMRMMRLLYRLSLGNQEEKHEQIMQFSKTVSSLQNKARELKYKERLEKIENNTMVMLFATGGGTLALMFVAMTIMMNTY